MVPLIRTILIVGVVTLVAACSKTDSTPQMSELGEPDPYRIELLTPTKDTSIITSLTDSLELSMNMLSPWGLHEYAISLSDNNEQECFYAEGHSHVWELSYSQKIKIEPTWKSPLTFKIITNNHDGETRTKQLIINLKP